VIRFLLLGLVLAGVWYLYRMVTQQGASTATVPPPEPANDAAAAETEEAEAEDLTECPVCRAYLPASAHEGCGRPDCPIPAVAAAAAEEGEPPAEDAPPAEPPPGEAPKQP
jgi:uncharacterized iron-regulated membrane protein